MRRVLLLAMAMLACGSPTSPGADAGLSDAGGPDDAGGPHDAGGGSRDAGTLFHDGGADAGRVAVRITASLFWSDAGIVDDPAVVSFARLMALASPDGHGGRTLSDWFHRFATTAHSERALPAQFIDEVTRQQGADPTRWDLARLPFVVTGIHNRIDLAALELGGHCGELRVSAASMDPTLQPFHVLFLFRQPLAPDDVSGGRVTCEGTARRWLALSALAGVELDHALRALLRAGLTSDRFLLIETVEQSLSPWEWRQWAPVEASGRLENPPLFQQLDVERLNQPGPLRASFLAWLETNAERADRRSILLPEAFRAPSARAVAGVPRTPLSLSGLAPTVAATFPRLRQQLEAVGCVACHTSDADFIQTRADRSISPFYAKELEARAAHLEALARGEALHAPFGPLQAAPVLPP